MRRFDLRGWALLAWVAAFGTLYAGMVLRTKAPWALDALARLWR